MANQAAAPIAQAPDEELVVTPPQVQQRLDVPLPAQSVAQQHPTTNVTVCVRVRPLLPSERVNQCQKCVKVSFHFSWARRFRRIDFARKGAPKRALVHAMLTGAR